MSRYEVKDVVSDYGVYEDGELKLILNSRRMALLIVSILEQDEKIHKALNTPPFHYQETDSLYPSLIFQNYGTALQTDKFFKKLERRIANKIFDDLENYGEYDSTMLHFIIGAFTYQTIRKKYTEGTNESQQ